MKLNKKQIKESLDKDSVQTTLTLIQKNCNDKQKLRLMAADFAESVLHIWEDWAKENAKEHLKAPRKLIELIKAGASEKEIKKAAVANAYAYDDAIASHAEAYAVGTADVAAFNAYAGEACCAAGEASNVAKAVADAYYADAYYAATNANAYPDYTERQKQKQIILKYFK